MHRANLLIAAVSALVGLAALAFVAVDGRLNLLGLALGALMLLNAYVRFQLARRG